MTISLERRPRLKKRPHDLHRCSNAEELLERLRARDIDPVALVYEFVKPSIEVGILSTGSIAWGVATELSDLDLLVLLPGADALKGKRKREIAGGAVKYLPVERPSTAEVSLFLSGIEIDIFFIFNPEIDRYAESGGLRDAAWQKTDDHAADNPLLTRLATGWILHGQSVAQRWRSYYETASFRIKWMATEFTTAAKNLEDMEAGIGLAKGHVAVIGVYAVTRLLRSLLAYNGCYCTSLKWMLKVSQLINTADPEMREALIRGRELAFPTLLEGADEERAYFGRVYEYCGRVRDILSREEAMVDVLASVIHDLDIIL
jgi:hypothetical protein